MLDQTAIELTDETKKRYRHWRMRIFTSIYFGYATFYFTRKSFTFAMPALMDDLGYTKADLGFLASVLYVSYGLSKFVSGIWSDRTNPRYFMSSGLMLTSLTNFAFGASSSLSLFALFWGLNGFFQGWGFAPCAKQLTYWFSTKERGFWWSLLSTANNLGGALIPILVACVLSTLSWRWAMYVPAFISLAMSLYLLVGLRGVPASLGLPPVEVFRGEAIGKRLARDTEAPEQKARLREVLGNRTIWILALASFAIYVIRSGVNDWVVLYLNKVKGYSILEAAGSVTWFEVGGFVGCLACGWGSDRFFAGQRVPYMVACALSLFLAVTTFWLLPVGMLVLDNSLLACIGFLIFGPQSLVGLASAELVDKKLACTAYGLTGGFAYLGAAVSGYPLGKIIDLWGWQGFFLAMLGGSLALFLSLMPLLGGARRPSQAQHARGAGKAAEAAGS